MINKIALSIQIILFIFIPSCSSIQVQTSPNVSSNLTDYNKEFVIYPRPDSKSIKRLDGVRLWIEVIGERTLVFDPGFSPEMFLLLDGNWIKIEDSPAEIIGGKHILSNGSGDPFSRGFLVLYPVIPDISKPSKLRIYVFGNIYNNDSSVGDIVGAYTDVTIAPNN